MKNIRKLLLILISIPAFAIAVPFLLILYFAEKEYGNTPDSDYFDED